MARDDTLRMLEHERELRQRKALATALRWLCVWFPLLWAAVWLLTTLVLVR